MGRFGERNWEGVGSQENLGAELGELGLLGSLSPSRNLKTPETEAKFVEPKLEFEPRAEPENHRDRAASKVRLGESRLLQV